ncbi:hypothetical protein DYH09_07005 [bacterium CPR1]|nr:hypothetical protein [bacterium CPR1]
MLVAGALFSLIVSVAFGALDMASRARTRAEGRLDPRKANRALLDCLSATLRRGNFVYTGSTIAFGPRTYDDLPDLERWGDSLIVAIPEDDPRTSAYTLVGVYSRPRQRVDRRNPAASEVVLHTVKGIHPATPGLPVTIDFSALPAGGTRVFDTYSVPQFIVLSSARDRVGMKVSFLREVPPGPQVSETYSTEVFLRNQ